jgi:hypothetical protein
MAIFFVGHERNAKRKPEFLQSMLGQELFILVKVTSGVAIPETFSRASYCAVRWPDRSPVRTLEASSTVCLMLMKG